MTQTKRPRNRPSKKTEAIEIRLSPEEKSAFLDACQRAGRTASAVLRDAMRGYTQFGPMARLPGSPIMIASAFAGASAGAFLLVSIIAPQSAAVDPGAVHPAFAAHDVNSDNVLTRDEYDYGRSDSLALMRGGEPENHRLNPAFARVVGAAFVGHDINMPAIMMTPERVSNECWVAAAAWLDQQQQARFAHWDENGDGVVPFAEFSRVMIGDLRTRFEAADIDSDGQLTRNDAMERSPASSDDAQVEQSHIAVCRADVGGRDATRMRSTADGSMGFEEAWARTQRLDLNQDGGVDFSEYVHGNAG